MVSFEIAFTDPMDGFLLGIDVMDGYTEDMEEEEVTEVTIFSVGFIIIRFSILWFR